MPLAAPCIMRAADAAEGGLALLLFVGTGAVWVLFLERTGGLFGRKDYWRKRGVRVWNWGLLGLLALGGAISLLIALVMAVTHQVIHC